MDLNACDVKAKFMRGFSDKTRLQILESIRHEEKTVTQIVDDIKGNQSNISQHLACLKGCGIITGRQEGKYMYYSLLNEQIAQLLTDIDAVFHQVKDAVAACEKNDEWDGSAKKGG